VLVCPECQAAENWRADLDRCAGCASTALVRRLGETVCRSCGRAEHAGGDARRDPSSTVDTALGEEVAAALARLFRRG
jgi:hypothetical protein